MESLCLSVRPPYASAIIRWGVTQTSRAGRPPKSALGKRISIHCSNSITVHPGPKPLDGGRDAREFLENLDRLEEAGALDVDRSYLPQVLEDVGHVLGSVRLVDVLSRTQHGWLGMTQTVQKLSPWTVPSFSHVWVLEDPELYEDRPWVRGHGALWRTVRASRADPTTGPSPSAS